MKYINSQDISTSANHIANQKTQKRYLKFNELSIEQLKPMSKRVDYWCQGLPGLGIRVSPKGTKTWFYLFRYKGMQKRMSLGRYPAVSLSDAINKYADAKKAVLKGFDPLFEKHTGEREEREELILSELIEYYLEHNQKIGKKSWKQEERNLRKYLLPELRNKKISQVTPKDLSKIFHYVIVTREAPVAAKRLYSYIRRLFNFAAEMGLMRRRDNPCLDIKLKFPNNRRERHLSPKEIYLFWNTLNDIPMSPIIRLALRFMILTVARSCEVREMKWSDVDLNTRIWILPKTKNGRMHRVYLGNLSILILNDARKYSDGTGLVFGSTRHFKTCGKLLNDLGMLSSWALSQPIRRHFEMFNIQDKFYPHDLRRTGATLIAGLFGRRDFASMALNHTNKDVTDIYDQYGYDLEKKLMLNALNRAIEIIVNSKNVESVPSFEELRQVIIEPEKPIFLHQGETNCIEKDFRASFSSPVSYKLSYAHDVLGKPI
ncbi:MAG: integrase arm-type DNA-binding domain-containing protein [Bacteroidota bacterium]